MTTTTINQDIAAIARLESVQKILEVVCRTTGLGFAAVARVTDSKWMACAVRDEISFGLPVGGELEVRTTICNEVRQSRHLVVIDHVAEDPVFCGYQAPKEYGFQSYISVPIITTAGVFFGTLCAIDPRPARLNTPEVVGMFQLFAELIAQHLNAEERYTVSESALLTEREASQLREQFIAVLGHDLRNPLMAIRMTVESMRDGQLAEEDRSGLELVDQCAARMSRLITHIMDFTHRRLGKTLPLAREPAAPVQAALAHVAGEVRAAYPGRRLIADLNITAPVCCDVGRVSQLAANLLSNAMIHGDPASPVMLRALTTGAEMVLIVNNRGPHITPAAAARLFEPYVRGAHAKGGEGLGLGLFIAAEIARGHGGTLMVDSTPEGSTTFTFRMPLEVVVSGARAAGEAVSVSNVMQGVSQRGA